MGKVIRLSKKTEKDLKELKTILIKKLDNKLDEIEQEVWEQYILPNDNQLIDVAIEIAIRQLKGS